MVVKRLSLPAKFVVRSRRKVVLVISAFLLLQSSGIAAEQKSGLAFTILHTNDLHSHEEPFRDNGRNVGGLARIAHLLKTLRANSQMPVVTVDAGDIFQGTPFFETYKGETEVECLNKMGYDIFTVGNHEFDEGSDNLAAQLSKAKFDIISANLDVSSQPTLTRLVKPSVVKTIKGERVGFVGAITPSLSALANKLGGVKLKAVDEKWTDPIKEEVDKLKAQGINKIIVVSHCGVDAERQIAERVPDVDVIIGGHSHTRLDKPIVTKHADGSVCLNVQTGAYGRALGRLELAFDESGKVDQSKTRYRLINITERVFEDPDVKSYIMDKGKPFAGLKTTIVGTAEANFDNRFAKYPHDSPIGDLICDAMADAAKPFGATISVQNRGGIRAKIEQGPISLEKVREVLPFDNRLVIATISGDTLLKTLENSVSGMLGARFLDVHGLKVIYDRSQQQGQRVRFVLAKNKQGEWKPVDTSSTYRLALNSYSFGGGEGYSFPDAKDVVETGKRTSVFLQSYLEKQKVVRPEVPTRLVEVNKDVAQLRDGNLVIRAKAGSFIHILTGADQGVDFVKRIGTIPLAGAQVVKSVKSPSSEYTLPVAALTKGSANKFLTAVVTTTDQNGTHKLISYPLEITPAIGPKK